MNWLLITYHDEEVRQQAKRVLQRAIGSSLPAVEFAANVAQARRLLSEHGAEQCQLVLLGATTPADADSSVGLSGREPTKALIAELKAAHPALPLVVLSTIPDDLLAEFLYPFEHCALVSIDAGFTADLRARARDLLEAPGEEKQSAPSRAGSLAEPSNGDNARRACLQLDIELCDERSATYHLRRVGTDGFEKPGMLVLDKREIDDILRESRQLETYVAERRANWLDDLGHLSERLSRLLFQGGDENFRCWERFIRHREKVGGIANTRVRLTVNDHTHPILVEALRDQAEATDDYWMLSAPVFRRFRPRGDEASPLFKDQVSRDSPINCLVIEADGEPGNAPLADGGAVEFDRLTHCRKEALEISKLLRTSAGGEVRRIELGRVKGDVCQYVLDTLRDGHWHIVHFCGHATGHSSGDAGLVLRADRNGVLPVTSLVEALGRTQLLFLSSCRSASAEIVTLAVEKGVPAVIGFRWVIDDEPARRFAAEFYRRLFDSTDRESYRYVEYAFMKARRAAHDGHGAHAAILDSKVKRTGALPGGLATNDMRSQSKPNPRRPDPSWVAPMLVMQLG